MHHYYKLIISGKGGVCSSFACGSSREDGALLLSDRYQIAKQSFLRRQMWLKSVFLQPAYLSPRLFWPWWSMATCTIVCHACSITKRCQDAPDCCSMLLLVSFDIGLSFSTTFMLYVIGRFREVWFKVQTGWITGYHHCSRHHPLQRRQDGRLLHEQQLRVVITAQRWGL